MSKPTKRAIALFIDSFADKDGTGKCVAVDTYKGTLPLWGQLVIAGYVEPMSGFLHPFSYRITPQGESFLKEVFHPNPLA